MRERCQQARTAHDSISGCHWCVYTMYLWLLRMRAIVPQLRRDAALWMWELLLLGEGTAIQECGKITQWN